MTPTSTDALMTDTARPGRYFVYKEIASGGMATVHLGRLNGAGGFSRTVAIKRLLPHYLKDSAFVAMFMEEARLASRIHHPNVVTAIDVVSQENELCLVMEYIHGKSFYELIAGGRVGAGIACAVVSQVLAGLQAIHEARDDRGEPLGIVHRDVSPQNVLVGCDGVARVADLGIAKAASRTQTTQTGQLKGKLAYMSPEQVLGRQVDRRTDLFAVGIVLWEALTGKRLLRSNGDSRNILAQLSNWDARNLPLAQIIPPFHGVLRKALARSPADRFQTAQEMATALQNAMRPAAPMHVAAWVKQRSGDKLALRAKLLTELERISAADLGSGVTSFASGEFATAVESPHGAVQAIQQSKPLTSESEQTALTASRAVTPTLPPAVTSWRWQALAVVACLVAIVIWFFRPQPNGAAAGQPQLAATAGPAPTSAQSPSQYITGGDQGIAASREQASDEPSTDGPPETRTVSDLPTAPSATAAKAGTSVQRARKQTTPPGGNTKTESRPSNCAIPYTVLPGGIKRYKQECFE